MKKYTILTIVVISIFTISLILSNNNKTINTSSNGVLSTKKIEWGVKRVENHEQPDLGSKNRSTLEQYKGIAIGNKEDKSVYLTFDEGYEAGYTPKILEILKQNNVKAAFFITAHYLNTQEELVQQMIKQGHIVGNHIPMTLMALI